MLKIVITGANGYIGTNLIKFLTQNKSCKIYAIINENSLPKFKTSSNVTVFKADLTKPLKNDIVEVIKSCDKVVHLAWNKGHDYESTLKKNVAMVDNLLLYLKKTSSLLFMSSVTGTPQTLSIYGKTKYKCSNYVLKKGGVVLVCGLVLDMENPGGSFKILYKLINKTNFAFRFFKGGPKVYPIRVLDLLNFLDFIFDKELCSDTYKLFYKPISFNRFIKHMEKSIKKKRIPIILSRKFLLILGNTGRFVPAFRKFSDKILTFFFKEDYYLSNLTEPPNYKFGELQ